MTAPATVIDIEVPSTPTPMRRHMPSDLKFPVESISVVVNYAGPGDKEVVHTINGADVEIVDCSHNIKKKMRAVKEDGQVCGFEPTGEEELILKVKYIRNA